MCKSHLKELIKTEVLQPKTLDFRQETAQHLLVGNQTQHMTFVCTLGLVSHYFVCVSAATL